MPLKIAFKIIQLVKKSSILENLINKINAHQLNDNIMNNINEISLFIPFKAKKNIFSWWKHLSLPLFIARDNVPECSWQLEISNSWLQFSFKALHCSCFSLRHIYHHFQVNQNTQWNCVSLSWVGTYLKKAAFFKIFKTNCPLIKSSGSICILTMQLKIISLLISAIQLKKKVELVLIFSSICSNNSDI